jgi:hypothetical protein
LKPSSHFTELKLIAALNWYPSSWKGFSRRKLGSDSQEIEILIANEIRQKVMKRAS